MDQETVRKTYSRQAKTYDYVFGAIIQPGRRKVIDMLRCQPQEKILEVGVGTGLSLPLYPEHVSVTGIDFSPEMLTVAQERTVKRQLNNVALQVMNAEEMTFPDNTFDKVVALYVASVVPNPDRLIAEMKRVCKPGGELFIVNHFSSTHPIIGAVERVIGPMLSRLLGYQRDVRLDDFVARTGIEIISQSPVNLMGNWTFLKVRNNKNTPVTQRLESRDLNTQTVEARGPLLQVSSDN